MIFRLPSEAPVICGNPVLPTAECISVLPVLWRKIGRNGSSISRYRRPTDLLDMETLRCCVRSNGKEGFLFINNHHHGEKLPEHRDEQIQVKFVDKTVKVTIPCLLTDTTCILPLRMKLSENVCLEYALAQPLSVSGEGYWFEKKDGMEPLFCFEDGTEMVIQDSTAVVEM